VLELANSDGRVLVTTDKDFGELVFRLRRVAFGVLLVRLAGAFTVLTPSFVRIRPPA
jgi:predicted nuclease of predicted toxin-antitoxin system